MPSAGQKVLQILLPDTEDLSSEFLGHSSELV